VFTAGLSTRPVVEMLGLLAADSWRCPRWLIELVNATRVSEHRLSSFAKVDGPTMTSPCRPETALAESPSRAAQG
jgi:hypothetical protein